MPEEHTPLETEIEADAERRMRRLTQRAEREADATRNQAERDAQRERDRVAASTEERVGRMQRVSEARLDLAVANVRRQARQRTLEAVRSEAEAELARLAGSPAGGEVLVDLAVRAIRAMSGEEFQLVLREQDRAGADDLARRVQAAASAALGRPVTVTVADDTVRATGGLVVRGAHGHEEADQTFDGRLARLWGMLRVQVAHILTQAAEADA